ncbi:MAG: hypothetical protein Kow0062_08060 [Acidobacteriota bacterium]
MSGTFRSGLTPGQLRTSLPAEGTGGATRFGAFVLAAPRGAPETLWRLAEPGEICLLWAPPRGPRLAAIGEVASVPWPHDAGARDGQARSLLAQVGMPDGPDGAGAIPCLLGGAPFDPDRSAGAFEALGPGRLVLPRWTWIDDGQAARLVLVVEHDRDQRYLARLARRGEALLDGLARTADASAPPRDGRWTPPPRSAWHRRFERIRSALGAGEVDKLVLAHAGRVEHDEPVDAADVLARLRSRRDAVTVFGIRRGGTAFVGATPETLFSLRDGHVVADALAGTISAPAGVDPTEVVDRLGERLLSSAKDRREQQIVVEAVADALRDLCTGVDVPARPAIRALGRVVHLSTPISGRVRDGVGWEQLVRALHPTPAVGGHPRDAALRLIAAIEDEPRGWFAGPFGRIDASGSAHVAVAIRSALIRGGCAELWAGAGIVRGSRPDAEFEETLAKMRRLRAALGAPA